MFYQWIDINYSAPVFKSNNKNIRIVDGDTVVINNKSIRLQGIDTPEIKQTCRDDSGQNYDCGIYAKIKLKQIINNNNVECSRGSIDKYGRQLSYCYVRSNKKGSNNRTNINLELVKQGYAYAYKHGNLFLSYYELRARLQKKGLFATRFEKPWKWRQSKKKHKKR